MKNLIILPTLLIAFLASSLSFADQVAESKPVAKNEPVVTLKTSMGDITMTLHPSRAPRTVANFIEYVTSGHYDGVIFHRVIPNFMVQTGGILPNGSEKRTREPVLNESINGMSNILGSVAMARTRNPDSATAQFYINVVDNLYLNAKGATPGYTVFGTVTSGLDVAIKISEQPTDPANNPKKKIILQKAILHKSKEKDTVSRAPISAVKKDKTEKIKTVNLKERNNKKIKTVNLKERQTEEKIETVNLKEL